MKLSIIVAAAENGVIGKENKLPWRLPGDLRFFKRLTTGHTVIMGRNTYQSIGKPLPDRKNIVLSRSVKAIAGCVVMGSLAEAIKACDGEEEVFLIGGGAVYDEAMDSHVVDRIYLTKVHHAVEGDTYFHIPDPAAWKVVSVERNEPDDNNAWPYSFIQLDRILPA